MEERLRTQISALEKQVEQFRSVQEENDSQLKNQLHSVTNNRIEQLIFQS